MLQHFSTRDSVGGATSGVLIAPTQQASWHAMYVRVRHEWRVADELSRRGVEHFLPRYETMRRWSDRRVQLTLPLFPGYIFVRASREQHVSALQLSGVVRFITFGSRLAVISEEEIATLQAATTMRRSVPSPYLRIGSRVRIRSGPLAGLEGVLRRNKGKYRMVVGVDILQQAVSIELETCDLESIS